MRRLPFVLLLALFFAEACKKYEEGPAFSLRSKKERLANSWGIKQYLVNGEDKTDDFTKTYKDYNIIFVRSGTYAEAYTYLGSQVEVTGTWKFADKDAAIELLDNTLYAVPRKYILLKLKEKEVWYYETDSKGVKREYHLKPQ